MSMDDLSNIIQLVTNSYRTTSLNTILTHKNLTELELIKNLLQVRCNPDYEEGTDDRADFIVDTYPLSADFLRGFKCGIAMGLACDPMLLPSPHHSHLNNLYIMADALMMETIGEECDDTSQSL